MQEQLRIPTGFSLKHTDLSFDALHEAYAESPDGQHLSMQVRYERYKPPFISNETWMGLLGTDVNNLAHMPLTNQLTATFFRYADNPPQSWIDTYGAVSVDATFSDQEKQRVRLAAIIHDRGEAKVGDTSFDLKSEEDTLAELAIMQELIQEHSTQLQLLQEDESVLIERMREVKDVVLDNSGTKEGRAFNTIERLGYIRTGMRAWEFGSQGLRKLSNDRMERTIFGEETEEEKNERELSRSLQWLSSNVLGNQIPKLLEYAKIYPAVHFFLQERAEVISDAFDTMPEDIFHNYKQEEQELQRTKFRNAKEVWFSAYPSEALLAA